MTLILIQKKAEILQTRPTCFSASCNSVTWSKVPSFPIKRNFVSNTSAVLNSMAFSVHTYFLNKSFLRDSEIMIPFRFLIVGEVILIENIYTNVAKGIIQAFLVPCQTIEFGQNRNRFSRCDNWRN